MLSNRLGQIQMFTFSQKKKSSTIFTILIVSIFLLMTGCSSHKIGDDGVEVVDVDPFETVNRKIFVFNEVIDDYLAEPVSDAYLWITPQFVQSGIGNFFSNLKDINVVLNDLMQGKVSQGAEDSGRFAINSTLGLLGLFDVATELGFEKHVEDFAQTLAVWGVPQGPYLVLPVLGPITTRGVPGSVFDAAANPATYVGFPVQILQMLNARANAEGALNFIDEAALDPYVFTRESFLQHRKHLITDGNADLADEALGLDEDFYDEDEDESTEQVTVVEEAIKVEDVDASSSSASSEIGTISNDATGEQTDSHGYKLRLSPSPSSISDPESHPMNGSDK